MTEQTFVPGKNGGMLRRGGGMMPSKLSQTVKQMLREGSVDAATVLLEKARGGDIKAIELVLAYGIGRPTEKVEVSGPEGGPIELVAGLEDHEKRALRDAIREHLATVEA
jgi:hypothetical protein